MAERTIQIVADDRERGRGVIEALEAAEGVEARVERLAAGDYRIGEQLVFERKTILDFAASVVQGRFFSQAGKLASSSGRGVLILEGTGRDLHSSAMSREALQGSLISASVFLGLAVLRSLNPDETARLIIYTGRQAARMIDGGLYRHGYRPKGKRKKQIFLLQGLPGIGPRRAENLIKLFGSVEKTMTASAEELAQAPGIGRKTAESIRYILREPPHP